jgi:C-terminal processing protease CtpA/Prc
MKFKGSLADKFGLCEGDLIVEINTISTANMPNEELRQVMRERIKLNSISLEILSLIDNNNNKNDDDHLKGNYKT